jgi:hypothetical protein
MVFWFTLLVDGVAGWAGAFLFVAVGHKTVPGVQRVSVLSCPLRTLMCGRSGIFCSLCSPEVLVDIEVGVNVFSLLVTAQDGHTQKTYELNVTRGEASSLHEIVDIDFVGAWPEPPFTHALNLSNALHPKFKRVDFKPTLYNYNSTMFYYQANHTVDMVFAMTAELTTGDLTRVSIGPLGGPFTPITCANENVVTLSFPHTLDADTERYGGTRGAAESSRNPFGKRCLIINEARQGRIDWVGDAFQRPGGDFNCRGPCDQLHILFQRHGVESGYQCQDSSHKDGVPGAYC